MPAAVLPLALENEPGRKRFTRGEVYRMLEAGLFEGRRFELIDGEVVDKMGQNPPHAGAIRRIKIWLSNVFGLDRVQGQLPLDVAPPDRELNEPEPDFFVLAELKPEYDRRHPRGDETLLVVEVSDTSLRRDTRTKRDLYTRAGVPEYWVANVPSRKLIVHRQPIDGCYRQVSTYSEGDLVSAASAPEMSILVAKLFGGEY